MGSAVRNAAIYARVSTQMQSRSSIDDQVRKCRQWAELHDFQILEGHIYRDETLSGVGYDRPSLKLVLDLAFSIAPPFTAILVDDTSRLSRATEDALTIFKRLNFAGVQLIAVSQGISSNDEQSETLVTVHGLVDSLYVRELAKKTHRGLEGTVLRRCHYGGACFGYKSVSAGPDGSKRLLVDKSEARIVLRIFEMSDAGYSLKRIARKFNEENVVGREQWCPTGIRSTLKNELYKGLVIWNRSRFVRVPGTNKRRRKMRDQSEWIQIERPELAVVPAELWNRVQARLNLHGAKPAEGRRRGLFARGFTSPYLFSGLLKCGECGANLIVGTGDLPPPAVQRLAAITSAAAHPKGATLFVEGQSPRGVFILCSGKAKLSTSSADGRSLILRISESGEVLGLPATVTGKPYELTAEVIEPTRANFIPKEDFLLFLREHGEAALRVAQQLGETYHSAIEEMRTIGLSHSASEKLARFLVDLAADHDEGKCKVKLTLTLTHEEIAQMIGASRETVTRLFADFKKKQLLKVKGSTLIITNRAGLENIVDS